MRCNFSINNRTLLRRNRFTINRMKRSIIWFCKSIIRRWSNWARLRMERSKVKILIQLEIWSSRNFCYHDFNKKAILSTSKNKSTKNKFSNSMLLILTSLKTKRIAKSLSSWRMSSSNTVLCSNLWIRFISSKFKLILCDNNLMKEV